MRKIIAIVLFSLSLFCLCCGFKKDYIPKGDYEIKIESNDPRIERALSSVPEKYQDILLGNGWRILVTTEPLESKMLGRLAGLTVEEEKTIYIGQRNADINRALIHEIGHAVAIINKNIDCTEEFKEIYLSEKDGFKTSNSIYDGHETSNEREYFAECFREYILNPENLKRSCSRTYEYIDAIDRSVDSL